MADFSLSQRAINKKAIALHILGCLCFIVLPFLFFPHPQDLSLLFQSSMTVPATVRDFIGQFILIGFFYVTYYLLIPKYYDKRKYGVFIFFVIIFFLLTVFLPSLLTGHFRQLSNHHPPGFEINRNEHQPPPGHRSNDDNRYRPYDGQPDSPPPGPDQNSSISAFLEEISHHIFLFLVVLFFALMLSSNNRWKKVQKEKTDAELSYLKAQINPHFLFNTLNSIYSLTLLKSDDAPEAVIKLSRMMRYVLHEANKERVDLDKELEYIQDYVELQKLRFGNQVPIAFQVNGPAGGKQIAALILISFVENAFKHGVNAEEDSRIDMLFNITGDQLQVSVRNNKVHVQHNEESGIGLQNVRDRLQHLYPATHTLTIENTETYFLVLLTIQLV